MGTHTTSVGSLFVTVLMLAFLFMHCFEFSSATTSFASSNMSSCFKNERDALLDLKHSLVDETNRLSSWTGDDCCRWYGIRCSGQTGHIVKLDLSNPFDQVDDSPHNYLSLDDYDFENQARYTLRGDQLSNSLQNLKHLTHLDLSFNDFSYIEIPDFIGSLVNLRYLNLSYSCFAGKNPHHLGNLSVLRYLDLSSSPYPEDPSLNIDNLWWVSQLYYLKHLDLSGADLSKATNWFPAINLLPSLSVLNLGGSTLDYSIIPAYSNVNLTSLIELDLSRNWFVTTRVPHWISNITGLVKLHLADNMLEGPIPESIGMLRSLTFLDLYLNSFTSLLPNTLSQLKKIVYLDLGGNKLEGPIPSEMGNLTQLRYLNLGGNQFTGNIPPSFGNLAFLASLDIGGNQLSGVITDDYFLNLTSLIHLDLSGNCGLSMNFSPTWTPPFQLTYLTLSSSLSSSFPPWIRYQKNLEILDLSNGSMTDNISENHFFYNLTSLKFLDLSFNPALSMNFTPTWSPPFQLTYLNLSSTKVGPRFPFWIRNQRELTNLDLSNAGIADNIPHWFSSLTANLAGLYIYDLMGLRMSDNKLIGKLLLIPSKFGYVDVSNNLLSGLLVANATTNSLLMLYASNNLLSGAFPTWLCNMKSITRIDLSDNQLSGRLPPCLGNLKNLDGLILTNNSFWGSIPNSLGSLPFLQSLHLRGNKFEGLLPSSFQNLTRLFTLDLGENALTGVIPSWIGQTLSNLKVLHLQSNRFNGPIPQQLCQLLNLHTINLASNYISGSIPSCFSNLTAMVRNPDVGPGFDVSNITGAVYKEKIWEHMEGVERLYAANYFISIDLSNNNITGVIPDEIMVLVELKKLNLSGNHIDGRIPEQIGNLRKLISLDLSRNKFSGSIPQNLSNLFSLTYLNLSFNELSGKIPTGYQLQTLNDPASYMGNWQLCGPPLNKCDGHHSQEEKHDDDDQDENVEVWFYSGMGPGLLVGFLGFCGALHFNKRWRNVYFCFFENVYDTLAVALAVKVARLHRKFQKHRTEG